MSNLFSSSLSQLTPNVQNIKARRLAKRWQKGHLSARTPGHKQTSFKPFFTRRTEKSQIVRLRVHLCNPVQYSTNTISCEAREAKSACLPIGLSQLS